MTITWLHIPVMWLVTWPIMSLNFDNIYITFKINLKSIFFYLKCKSKWTLHIVILDMTWCHVMLNCLNKLSNMTLESTQGMHYRNYHKHLIKYDYKSNCKDSFFSTILLVHGFQHPMTSISQGTNFLKTKQSFPIVNLSIFCHHPFWVLNFIQHFYNFTWKFQHDSY